MNVEEEVERLKEEIKRLGKVQDDGSYKVTFGTLFNDDRCANIFEALVGTLRAGKKRKVLTYDGELLLQGVHDNTLLRTAVAPRRGVQTGDGGSGDQRMAVQISDVAWFGASTVLECESVSHMAWVSSSSGSCLGALVSSSGVSTIW
ncbi:hypothetical protein FH972_004847 [Carpinus fangiana]|uniref:Costars domain-containing protein n=1 Tax=Carpinus fangiana TaxID=176857 RepID=A0A5N6QN56_9ROSI|nr:hypothetical protein FH972_004847 [Carpinus fangiana]